MKVCSNLVFTLVLACAVLTGIGNARAATWDECQQEDNLPLAVKSCTEMLGGAKTPYDRLRALNSRAIALLGQNKLDEAMKDMEAAFAIDSKDPMLFSTRGSIFSSQKKHERALADFKVSVDLAPKAAIAHYNLGQAYLLMNNNEQALVSFRRALQLEPNDESLKALIKKLSAKK